jgi:hypothetical protein
MSYTEQGLPFATGSNTSYKAAVSASARRGVKTAAYLRLLAEGGRTDHEAAAALGLPLSSVCSIRNGAVDCGLVVRGSEERLSPWGRSCAVWVLTSAGEVAAA